MMMNEYTYSNILDIRRIGFLDPAGTLFLSINIFIDKSGYIETGTNQRLYKNESTCPL